MVGEVRTAEAVLALSCIYGLGGWGGGRGDSLSALVYKCLLTLLKRLLWMIERVETGGVALLVWFFHSFLRTYRISILDRYSIDCHR